MSLKLKRRKVSIEDQTSREYKHVRHFALMRLVGGCKRCPPHSGENVTRYKYRTKPKRRTS